MYLFLKDSHLISPELRNFAAVGFIGAFTTMSTFAYESYRFVDARDWMMFGLNFAGTLILCLAAIYLGKEVTGAIIK